MKKKYINYLLFALVLSLCIFYFYGNVDGFQTSPVDFNNFSGTVTGIRLTTVDSYKNTEPPEAILKDLLGGGNLREGDVKMTMERPNGDLFIPYFYINPMGDSGSVSYQDDPYNVNIMPEILTALMTGVDPREVIQNFLITFNFSRNSKITPIILSNQNIKVIYNNIYANLYKRNLKLVSLILNKTIDYPTVDYSQYSQPVPILTPKVSVNLETRIASLTLKTSLSDILRKFKTVFSGSIANGNQPTVTLINSDGTTNTFTITLGTQGGTQGGTPGGNTLPNFLINNGSIQPTPEIKVYRLDFLNALFQMDPVGDNIDPYKLSHGAFAFGRSKNAIRFLFEKSPKIPDSVIQSFIGPMLMSFKYNAFTSPNSASNGEPLFNPDQIVTINLINPSQEIKVDIGTETKNMNPSSVLDEIRKILSI
jgi:hypothetical protein